ncbi:MAG: HAD family hydrolase [Acidobacteria bacterium]|nr:HAD family hydrolase [Acidobacteriota bacterium]
MTMLNRAIFLDRDGTVNVEVGYVNHLDRLELYPWTAEAIRLINQAGYKAIVLTNQSGVARKYMTEELVRKIHEKLQSELRRQGAYLDAIYYCPHHPAAPDPAYRIDCECHKPKPGMVERGRREFNLDLTQSFVIGDKYLDIELARNVGAKGVLVLTGYGLGEYEHLSHTWPKQPDYVAESLLAAVQWILNQGRD